TREMGLGYGIHWHVSAPVEFFAADEHGEEISWIRTTLPDGRTVEYEDVTNPLSPEEIEQAEKQVMDCVDCHNRVGHPFPAPEDLIDEALDDGRVSRDLPYAKMVMTDLLTNRYESREDALAAVGLVKEEYQAEYPEVAADSPEAIDQAEEVTKELMTRVVFEEPGVTWEDFPDHSGHKEFPGCFRCHDGKHQTAEGETIRLHCNICHSVPENVGEGDRVPQLPVASVQEPASHLESSFMADHRFEANSACESCHGEIEFGSDDSSFCANSSCHGQAWPDVDLDAAFAHPIPLEGGHAEVWCHDCHEGVRKPVFECANCHEPPTEPHFGDVCEDCHTPFGWDQVDLGEFQHPIALEGAHAEASCIDCHAEQVEGLEYVCANCHEPPSDTHFGPSCEDCHTPTTFSDATLPPELHPVPLEGAHAEADCGSCHTDPDAELDYICANCHTPPENHLEGSCDTCHSPEGFAESASFIVGLAPGIPHDIEGRDDCLLCHDPDGQIQPAPANHDYENEQCTLCHKLED
ncbi:MAG: hypothetical protein ACK2UC_05665, partial [Anaerolineae bacterium]